MIVPHKQYNTYAVKMCLHVHMMYIQTDAVSTRSRCRPCYMEQLLWDKHTHTHTIRRVELEKTKCIIGEYNNLVQYIWFVYTFLIAWLSWQLSIVTANLLSVNHHSLTFFFKFHSCKCTSTLCLYALCVSEIAERFSVCIFFSFFYFLFFESD